MPAPAKPVPEGYHTITPYLIVDGAAAAIDFYRRAFDAREHYRMPIPGGRVGHAELQIGTSRLMLADEFPDMDARGPRSRNGTPVTMLLYVPDCDATFARALAAGAAVKRPMQDQFYGDRAGTLEDPFGHVWTIASRKEELTPAEIEERMKGMGKK